LGTNWANWRKQKQSDYHPNFKRRARYRKRLVKYTCEHCGARKGEERINKQGQPYKVMVAAAHVNHDPHNSRAKLIILCQVCHILHDRYDHADKARRTYYRKKREAMIQAGQLELFGTHNRRKKAD
jgi:hypothetical protein